MALDYGRRRIGVASSDPTGTIASPHSVVPAGESPERPPRALIDLLARLGAREVVVGIPLSMDGSEGEMAKEARRFGRAVAARTGLAVVEWDERLSTARAEREMRDMGMPKRKRESRGLSDMMAAAVILRGYLASRGR